MQQAGEHRQAHAPGAVIAQALRNAKCQTPNAEFQAGARIIASLAMPQRRSYYATVRLWPVVGWKYTDVQYRFQ